MCPSSSALTSSQGRLHGDFVLRLRDVLPAAPAAPAGGGTSGPAGLPAGRSSPTHMGRQRLLDALPAAAAALGFQVQVGETHGEARPPLRCAHSLWTVGRRETLADVVAAASLQERSLGEAAAALGRPGLLLGTRRVDLQPFAEAEPM
jgi:hypothetical protein